MGVRTQNRYSLGPLFIKSLKDYKTYGPKLGVLLLFIVIALTIILFISTLIQEALLDSQLVHLGNLFTYRLIGKAFGYIVFLALATCAQILFINTLSNPLLPVVDAIKSISKYFIDFFFFTVTLTVAFFITNIPLYASVLLFALGMNIFGILSSILGIILTIVAAVYLFATPFNIIDQKHSFRQAIRSSLSLVRKHFPEVLINLIIIGLLMTLLNIISFYLLFIPILGVILNFIILIFTITYSFIFAFNLYLKIKA